MPVPSATPVDSPRDRLTGLDGLRGIASLVVVLTHISLATAPAGGDALSSSEIVSRFFRQGGIGIFFDGGAAVAIFFVLSGVVLTLPFLRAHSIADWIAYYPRRLVRLYLPVWGSLVAALGWFFLVPRRSDAGLSDWMQAHDFEFIPRSLVKAALLLRVTDLNTPLWTLYLEVLFSLLLPVFILLVRPRSRTWAWAVVAGAFAAIAIGGQFGNLYLTNLPQFLIGCVIGAHLHSIVPFLTGRRWLRWSLAVLTLLTLEASGLFAWLGFAEFGWLTWVLRILGSAGAVLTVLAVPMAAKFTATQLCQWLGRISFSLYLTHEPLVVSLRLLMDHPSLPLAVLIGVPVSLAFAQLFYWVVERPAHHLARRMGSGTQSLLADHSSDRRATTREPPTA